MYREGELELHPEFQRFFRWSVEQKSRLVESLLLGIPIPPIFVSEREDGKWDVIDGVQRLSTIFQLMGELKDENGVYRDALTLTKTHYLEDLEGKAWSDENSDRELSDASKIRIKRARWDVNIVRSTSDQDVKYEVFQRLNRGGAEATDQEVRNCMIVMANPDYFEWINRIAKYESFQNCLMLTDKALEEAFDLELVIRFVTFVRKSIDDLRTIDELGAYLNREAINQAKDGDFDREHFESIFMQTFDFLYETTGGNSFRKFKEKYYGPMLVTLFEVVGIGIAHRLLMGENLPDMDLFVEKHRELWDILAELPFHGSGVRASTRIPETIKFGRGWVQFED